MKKHLWKMGVGVIAGVILIVITFMLLNALKPSESERVTLAKEEQAISDIFFYGTAKQVIFVIASTVILLAILIVSYGYSRSRILKASVHTARIGRHSEIPVKHSDLPNLSPVLTGLVTAENLKAYTEGQDKAFKLYCQMAEVQTQQIRALVGRTGLFAKTRSLDPGVRPIPALPDISDIPTFGDLLDDGLQDKQHMVLGYDLSTGNPRKGTFQEVYSSFLCGATGTGKTTWLACLIAQAILLFQSRVYVLDPHYPDNESLISRLGSLVDLPNIVFVNERQERISPALYDFHSHMQARLTTEESKDTPLVLCIDELAFWMKTKFARMISLLSEKIAMEGRKTETFLLVSSQSTLVSKTGDSSAVRDSLASSFVFHVKPRVASLLLQDKDEVEKVKTIQKGEKGVCLFSPTNDDSRLVKVPFCHERDIERVYHLVSNGNGLERSLPSPKQPLSRYRQPEKIAGDTEIDTFFQKIIEQPGAPPELPQVAQSLIEKPVHSEPPGRPDPTGEVKDFAFIHFVKSWQKAFASRPVGVSDLFALAEKLNLGDKSERSQKTKLGLLISQYEGVPVTGCVITPGEKVNGAKTWSLTL